MNIQNHADHKQDFPEISQLIIACSYRFWTALALAIFSAAILGTVATALVPVHHMASGHVRVRQREGYLLTTQQTRSEDAAFVRAQESLVLQEQTLEKALLSEDFQAMDFQELIAALSPSERIEWIKGQIKADISAGSEVMTITASNPSPEIAIQVASSVTQAYVNAVTEQLTSSRRRRIQELEAAAREADQTLRSRWMTLQSKAGKIGSGNPQSLAMNEQARGQNYRDTSNRLRSLQFQRSQLESQLQEELKKQIPTVEVSDTFVAELVEINPDISNRREHLRKIESQIRETESISVSNEAPRLLRLRKEYEHYLEDLRASEKRVAKTIRDQQQSKLASVPVSNVSGMQNQIALIEQEEKFLTESMEQLEVAMEDSGGKSSIELEMIRHEIDREEKLADSLWKTLEELRIEERAEPRISLIDLPTTAEKTSRSKQLKAAATAVFFGVVFAMLSVGYVEWRSCRIHSVADIMHHAPMEVFGATSAQKSLPILGWLGHRKIDSMIDGSNEVAALMLLQPLEDGSLPSLMVTSATQTEGRDLPAVNIAEALAGTDRRVLLINCDAASGIAEVPSNPASKQNSYKGDTSSRIFRAANYRFDYFGFNTKQDSLALIATQLLPRLLDEVESIYDAIVVLGPPVLSSPESVLIATRCDRTVLTTVVDQTQWNHLKAACHRLEFSKAVSMGAIFQVPSRRSIQLELIAPDVSNPPNVADELVASQKKTLAESTSPQQSFAEESIHSQLMELKNHIARQDGESTSIAPPHTIVSAKPSMNRLHRKSVE